MIAMKLWNTSDLASVPPSPMDIQDLQAFLAVANHQSFSAAAEQLHLTQPAISKRVAGLEQRLGHRLFDRIGRRVDLTDAGRTLLPFARSTLSTLTDARHALSHLDGQLSGQLSIGTSHHIGLHRLPPVLGAYTQRYPAVDLDIHFMDSEVACEAVLAGELELGIVTLPTNPPPTLACQPVWDDPLRVVVAAGDPWCSRPSLPIQALAERPAVLPDEATYTHRIIRAELARHGIAPRVRLATNYLETLKMLVSIGLGWSLLPETMVDDSLCALTVPDLQAGRCLGVVSHRDRTLSAAASALLAATEANGDGAQ